MMNRNSKNLFFLFLIAVLTHCSGGSDSTSVNGKNLSITVSGSRSFNPDIEHGQIDYYQVTISNEDLEDPIVERFAGDAENAKIMGIPSGDNYVILVEAYNLNGLVIRRGQKEGIHIYRGKVTSVDLVMNGVPIFTNITDRSAITGNRLRFEVFAEPESSVEVLNTTNNEETSPIVDQSTSLAYVDTTVNEEGLYTVTPSAFDYGTYSFQVRDKETNESSSVAVTLYRSTVRPGVSFSSGGSVTKIGDELIIRQAGPGYYRPVDQTNGDLGHITFMEMVEEIF